MSLPKILRPILLPLIVFLCARAAFILIVRSAGMNWLSGDTLIRFDSFLYLRVSKAGYTLRHCQPSTGYAANLWCGNSGWFPLYPWLIALLHKLRIPSDLAAVSLSAAGNIGLLIVAWNGFLGRRATWRNVLALALIEVSCGAVYLHAAFPVSIALCLLCICLLAAIRGAWWSAAFFGALAAMAYPSIIVVSPAIALWSLVVSRGRPWRERVLGLVPAGAIAFGFAYVQAIVWKATGVWNAFFLVQAKYGHHLTSPLGTLRFLLAPIRQGGLTEATAPAWQTLLALVVVALTVWGAFRARDRGLALVALCVVALWLFPLSMGKGVTFARAESLLAPAGLVMKEVPAPIATALLIIMMIVERLIVLAFLHKSIV